MARGEFGIGANYTQFLLAGKGNFPLAIPTVAELTLVLLDPLLRDVVGRVGGTGGEVHKEGLVGHQGLLLADPTNRLFGQVLGQVIALLKGGGGFDGGGAFVKGWIPLVVFAADEAIEILETAAPGGPCVKRPHGRTLPHGHLVALAQHGGGVAVELQSQGQGRFGVGPHGTLPRCRRSRFGDVAHAHGMVIAPGQQRLTGGGTEGGGVETGVFQPFPRQFLEGGGMAGATKGTRGPKAHIV